MKASPPLFLLVAALFGLALFLILGWGDEPVADSVPVGIPGLKGQPDAAPAPPEPNSSERIPEASPEGPFLSLDQLDRIKELAGQRMESVRKQLLQTTELNFRFLDESLEKLKDVQPFGGFSRVDFPEIRSGTEALQLANSLQQAEGFLALFTESMTNPKRHQTYEHLIMEDAPKLIISSDPRIHFYRLTGRFGETVPQELVAPMRKAWRDALAQQALLLAEKEPWQAAYRSATLDSGVSFPPPGGEEVFPLLSRYNQLLKNERETYLKTLEKILRDHDLMDDR